MEVMKCIKWPTFLLCILIGVSFSQVIKAQTQNSSIWQKGSLLNHYRPLQPATDSEIVRIDLDGDGDPDIMKYSTANGFNVYWIDDNDNMTWSDIEGDTSSDCLLVDINKDGKYGSYTDVVIDWIDTDADGKANFQIYLDFASETDSKKPWGPGHFMVNIDADKDDIMNYVDFSNFKLRCWIHDGKSDFYEDYHGNTLFLKIHASPQNINDLRLNWENPFLFYDPDKDGLTEYAVRLLDRPTYGKPGDKFITNLTGKIDYVTMSYDLDNDNSPGSPFDFDMTINFRGGGFDYTDQVHKFTNQRIVETDTMFLDPRFRQLNEFIYPDHKNALPLVFKSNWNQTWFVYDEDDDCDRWERVEMLDPLDPYIVGVSKGGLDNNNQSDPVGDRGEWDLDNSGKGNLYISPLDGKIHLFGAEKGYWRIDQNAWYYQGMGNLYDGYGPKRSPADPESFALISYKDTDNNGFFDQIAFDLNGDKIDDFTFSLKELGIDDKAKIIDVRNSKYADFKRIKTKIASDTWKSAQEFVKLVEGQGINTQWYAFLKHPKSIRQQYSQGYWLKFYLFMDLLEKAKSENNAELAKKISIIYFGQNHKK